MDFNQRLNEVSVEWDRRWTWLCFTNSPWSWSEHVFREPDERISAFQKRHDDNLSWSGYDWKYNSEFKTLKTLIMSIGFEILYISRREDGYWFGCIGSIQVTDAFPSGTDTKIYSSGIVKTLKCFKKNWRSCNNQIWVLWNCSGCSNWEEGGWSQKD